MLRIKNWQKFQHFKNRRPPWIKLYRDILDRRDINMISDRAFRVLILLWLLASEDNTCEGLLPSISDISFRTRLDEDELIKCIQELGAFLEGDDINMISPRYQLGPSETETERERETEKRQSNARARVINDYTKDFEKFWLEYPSKKGKKAAYKAWEKAKDKPHLEQMLFSLQQQKSSDQWKRGYIPNPSTWLNQGRWDDEILDPVIPKNETHLEAIYRRNQETYEEINAMIERGELKYGF